MNTTNPLLGSPDEGFDSILELLGRMELVAESPFRASILRVRKFLETVRSAAKLGIDVEVLLETVIQKESQ